MRSCTRCLTLAYTYLRLHLYDFRARKTVDLNVDAANRFISAAIPDLTDEQRAALRAGNAAGRKRAAAEAAAAAAAETGARLRAVHGGHAICAAKQLGRLGLTLRLQLSRVEGPWQLPSA